jgi:hypothetical protein
LQPAAALDQQLGGHVRSDRPIGPA